MTSDQKNSQEFKNYPLLTLEEFAEACHHLDRRYCQAILGPVRRQWKLNVRRALGTSFTLDSEYCTYIQIIRPLDDFDDHADLLEQLDILSFGVGAKNGGAVPSDAEMMEITEADDVSTTT